jgi:hypothetical protein
VKKILDAAQAEHVAVTISLWSFDMLQGGQNAPLDDNFALLTTDAKRQAYVDRVLVPLVNGLKGHPALYAWEIFNEPEGMTTQHGWTQQNGGRTVDESVVQTTRSRPRLLDERARAVVRGSGAPCRTGHRAASRAAGR